MHVSAVGHANFKHDFNWQNELCSWVTPLQSTRVTRWHWAHFGGADLLPKVDTERTLRPLSKRSLPSRTGAASPAGTGPAPRGTRRRCSAVTRGSPVPGNERQPRTSTAGSPAPGSRVPARAGGAAQVPSRSPSRLLFAGPRSGRTVRIKGMAGNGRWQEAFGDRAQPADGFIAGDSTKSPSQRQARHSLGRRPEVSQPVLATIPTFRFAPN